MFNPLKHLAKALYADNWDDMPYLPLIVIMALFAVVVLIMSIICVTGNMEPRELGELAKVLPPDHVAWKFITISLGISVISIIMSIMASEKYTVDNIENARLAVLPSRLDFDGVRSFNQYIEYFC